MTKRKLNYFNQISIKGSNKPPGLKFLGCGVTAAAPDDLRDLKRVKFYNKLIRSHTYFKRYFSRIFLGIHRSYIETLIIRIKFKDWD